MSQELVTHNPAIVNYVDDGAGGLIPLHYATASGQRDIVAFLIAHGADVHQRDSDGMTALHHAVMHGNSMIVQSLLEHGAHVNQLDNFDQSPLQIAIRRGKHACTRLLIEHHANINQQTAGGGTLLHTAVFASHGSTEDSDTIRLLIAHGTAIRQRDDGGYLASQRWHQSYACIHAGLIDALRAQQIARTLAMATHPRLGADSQLAKLPRELLHYIGLIASWEEQREDRTEEDSTESTPLQQAASRGQHDIVEFLIAHGADVHQRDSDGMTALHHAATDGNPMIVQSLLKHGAHVNQLTRDDQSSLQIAISRGNHACARILIEHHANVNQQAADGSILLHEAAGRAYNSFGSHGSIEELDIIRLLVARGADIMRRRDNAGFTPSMKGVYDTEVDLIDALRAEQIARTLAMATHPRLGADSQLARLPQKLLHYVSQLASWEEQREDRTERANMLARKLVTIPLADFSAVIW